MFTSYMCITLSRIWRDEISLFKHSLLEFTGPLVVEVNITAHINPYVAIGGGIFYPQTHFLSFCSETALNYDKCLCDFSWIYVG